MTTLTCDCCGIEIGHKITWTKNIFTNWDTEETRCMCDRCIDLEHNPWEPCEGW